MPTPPIKPTGPSTGSTSSLQAKLRTDCCEPFDPEPWQEKEITWQDKIFAKDHVTSFFHIPLNIGSKIVKNMGLIERAAAKPPHQLM